MAVGRTVGLLPAAGKLTNDKPEINLKGRVSSKIFQVNPKLWQKLIKANAGRFRRFLLRFAC